MEIALEYEKHLTVSAVSRVLQGFRASALCVPHVLMINVPCWFIPWACLTPSCLQRGSGGTESSGGDGWGGGGGGQVVMGAATIPNYNGHHQNDSYLKVGRSVSHLIYLFIALRSNTVTIALRS